MLARLLSAARHPSTVRLMRAGYAALARLPYRYIVCFDTEFRTQVTRTEAGASAAWSCGADVKSACGWTDKRCCRRFL